MENPKLRFKQVEVQFSTYQVTTKRTKFDLVIPLLDTRVAAEVQRSIFVSPYVTPYNNLTATLTKCFSKSEEARSAQLLDGERVSN